MTLSYLCDTILNMKYTLIKDNKPIMRKVSEPVTLPLSSEDKETLDFMLKYLKKSQDEDYCIKHNIRSGVGLAAIQLGYLKRMFAIYYVKDETNEVVQYQLVNPKITNVSMKMCALEAGEGCLSVDDEHKGLVHRYETIEMEAFDVLQNKNITIKASGFDAIVLQHEYDHLEGKFFYDRIDKNNPNKKLDGEEIL